MSRCGLLQPCAWFCDAAWTQGPGWGVRQMCSVLHCVSFHKRWSCMCLSLPGATDLVCVSGVCIGNTAMHISAGARVQGTWVCICQSTYVRACTLCHCLGMVCVCVCVCLQRQTIISGRNLFVFLSFCYRNLQLKSGLTPSVLLLPMPATIGTWSLSAQLCRHFPKVLSLSHG